MDRQINADMSKDLIDDEIVSEYQGATVCAVNPVVAAKKDPDTGAWTQHGMAQDYRPVNQHTPQDQYGLHRPEEIFQLVGKAGVFSKLDLRQVFLQCPIALGDEDKTCFWVGNKLMYYKSMPYGLNNASAHFKRCNDTIVVTCIARQQIRP